MKCVFLFIGAVCATTQLFQFVPTTSLSSSSAVGASQPNMAVLPTPGWSGNWQTSESTGRADSAAGAELLGAALVTGLLGRYFARTASARPVRRRPAFPASRRAGPLVMAEAPVKEEEKTEEAEAEKAPEEP